LLLLRIDLWDSLEASVLHVSVYKVLVEPIEVFKSLFGLYFLYEFGCRLCSSRRLLVLVPLKGRFMFKVFRVLELKTVTLVGKLLEFLFSLEVARSILVQAAADINLFNFTLPILAILGGLWVEWLGQVHTDSYRRYYWPSKPHLWVLDNSTLTKQWHFVLANWAQECFGQNKSFVNYHC